MSFEKKSIAIIDLEDLNFCPKCGCDGDENLQSNFIRITCRQCGLEM